MKNSFWGIKNDKAKRLFLVRSDSQLQIKGLDCFHLQSPPTGPLKDHTWSDHSIKGTLIFPSETEILIRIQANPYKLMPREI